MARQITRLPTSVSSHLRSNTILANVAQIAEELVCNSIDAGATQIQVAIDGEACHMKVDDDGCGINRDDLTLLGERHATSKLHCLDELERGVVTLGFRGEALSSLTDVALVEVTSRCRGMPNTYRKILKGSATISIGLCSEQRTHGTTVIVRDMFYNQPVRRRLLNSRKILQSVKDSVFRFVLIHPQVSFTVTDLSRKEVLLHTKSAATLTSTLSDMFGEDLFSRLQEIDYAEDHLRLTGFLSKTRYCHPSKALQYFYINRRFVLKTSVHKLLNSWVGLDSYCDTGKQKIPLEKINFQLDKAGNGKTSIGKHLYSIFVLNMTCPLSDYDITFEASKTLVEFKDSLAVLSFVKSVLQLIWGNQSANINEGFLQGPGSSAVVLKKKNPSNDNINEFSHFTTHKDGVPVMAVRRALVQHDFCHPSDYNEDLISKSKAAAASVEISKHPRTALKTSVEISPPPIKKSYSKAPCLKINFEKEKQTAKTEKKFQTDWNSFSDGTLRPGRDWHISPCRTQRMPYQPVLQLTQMDTSFAVMRSESLLNDIEYQSPDSKKQVSHSNTTLFTPSLHNNRMSGFMSDSDEHLSSPVPDERWLCSSSSSPIDIYGSPSDRFLGQCKQSEPVQNFIDDDEAIHSFSMDEKPGQNWLGPDDHKFRTPLRSKRDDLFDVSRIPDASDFFPEVSSSSLEVASEGEYSPKWKWSEVDSDESESDINWTLKMQGKHRRFDESDTDGLDNWFSPESCSLDPSSHKYLGGPEIRDSIYNKWKIKTEDSKDIENIHEDLDCLQNHGNDVEVTSLNRQTKRKLDLVFEDSNLKYCCDHGNEQENTSQEKFQPASPQVRHHLRRTSGPPFYRPPKRHGLHLNPMNSLVTVERLDNDADNGSVVSKRADGSTENQSKATPDENETWGTSDLSCSTACIRESSDVGMEQMEINSIQLTKPGTDCTDQLPMIQAMPCIQLSKYTPEKATDNEETLHPLNREKSIQASLQTIENQYSKYRSTDVNSNDNEAAELPMETVKAMFKEWSNPCMKIDGDVLDLSSGILASNRTSLLPSSISKDIFKHVRVLQQVDKKFIASVACGVLLLIDQHAADERVRLEELREHVLCRNNMKQISLLTRTQELTIAFGEQQMLQTYHQQIEDWGWRFKMASMNKSQTSQRLGSSSGGMCKVLLSAVPCILGVSLTAGDLTEYLRQLADTQGSSAPPPAVIKLLNNKACRGAIMFGDTLLPAECNQLIEHLKTTSLCFQCAHGRPTMVPLVDLRALHKCFDHSHSTRKGPSMSTEMGSGFPVLTANKKWHGLQTGVRPTLERAQERLAQAHGV